MSQTTAPTRWERAKRKRLIALMLLLLLLLLLVLLLLFLSSLRSLTRSFAGLSVAVSDEICPFLSDPSARLPNHLRPLQVVAARSMGRRVRVGLS